MAELEQKIDSLNEQINNLINEKDKLELVRLLLKTNEFFSLQLTLYTDVGTCNTYRIKSKEQLTEFLKIIEEKI